MKSRARGYVERSDSFCPKRHVAASMSITLAPNTMPDYIIAVAANDAEGKRTYQAKEPFNVE